MGAVGCRGWKDGGGRVEEFGALDVGGYDCYFVGVVEGKVGVYEDEDVGDGLGQSEGGGEEGPGVGVCVEDDGKEGWGGFCGG